MLKALLIGLAIFGSGATASFAAAISPAGTEVTSTRGHQETDAKKAWLEREVTKILEGRTAPLDSDR